MNNLLIKERSSDSQNKPLRVGINAQLLPGTGFGGVESALLGLIHALGQIRDGDEEYLVITPWDNPGWLERYLGPNQRIVCGPPPSLSPSKGLRAFNRLIAPIKPRARYLLNQLFPSSGRSPWSEMPVSDGYYESLGCEVIHFPFQRFILCALPSIFNPHDLQHLHFPQFFSPSALAWRESIYPTACHLAHTVVAGSRWVKRDLVRQYRIYPGKIQVIPWAPPTEAVPPPSPSVLHEVKAKYDLTVPYALYPAVTWEHKNHLRLLEALAHLRNHNGLLLTLVCTGYQHPPFWPKIDERLGSLNLHNQVKFLGNVPPQDLRAIYHLSHFVIVPTLFEAASGPVFEAWQEGIPVACSTVTSLPEQVADAAVLFDPYSIQDIAEAARRVATDGDLRAELAQRGKRRLLDFSWERTAKAYRAVYRRAAGRKLSEEDRFLLSWDWMRNPKREKEGIP